MNNHDELELKSLLGMADLHGSVRILRNGKCYVIEALDRPAYSNEVMQQRALISLRKFAEAGDVELVQGDDMPDRQKAIAGLDAISKAVNLPPLPGDELIEAREAANARYLGTGTLDLSDDHPSETKRMTKRFLMEKLVLPDAGSQPASHPDNKDTP